MKTLVIHPKDPTTDFLIEIYKDNKDWTIINHNIHSGYLIKEILIHDKIIMMGHGMSHGLLGFGNLVITSEYISILQQKDCVCIWCNADLFVEKYKLKGFYTGMIISEMDEAKFYNIKCTKKQIEESNILFSIAIKSALLSKNPLETTKSIYKNNENLVNPIISYNSQNIYYS